MPYGTSHLRCPQCKAHPGDSSRCLYFCNTNLDRRRSAETVPLRRRRLSHSRCGSRFCPVTGSFSHRSLYRSLPPKVPCADHSPFPNERSGPLRCDSNERVSTRSFAQVPKMRPPIHDVRFSVPHSLPPIGDRSPFSLLFPALWKNRLSFKRGKGF